MFEGVSHAWDVLMCVIASTGRAGRLTGAPLSTAPGLPLPPCTELRSVMQKASHGLNLKER